MFKFKKIILRHFFVLQNSWVYLELVVIKGWWPQMLLSLSYEFYLVPVVYKSGRRIALKTFKDF